MMNLIIKNKRNWLSVSELQATGWRRKLNLRFKIQTKSLIFIYFQRKLSEIDHAQRGGS